MPRAEFVIPTPTPDIDGLFWYPPDSPVCRVTPGHTPCRWAVLCGAERQRVQMANAETGPRCASYRRLEALDVEYLTHITRAA